MTTVANATISRSERAIEASGPAKAPGGTRAVDRAD